MGEFWWEQTAFLQIPFCFLWQRYHGILSTMNVRLTLLMISVQPKDTLHGLPVSNNVYFVISLKLKVQWSLLFCTKSLFIFSCISLVLERLYTKSRFIFSHISLVVEIRKTKKKKTRFDFDIVIFWVEIPRSTCFDKYIPISTYILPEVFSHVSDWNSLKILLTTEVFKQVWVSFEFVFNIPSQTLEWLLNTLLVWKTFATWCVRTGFL